MLEPKLCGVEAQLFRDLVELNFQGEARLRRAVPALGAAGRFVREGAQAAEAVARDFVCDGLKRARVERGGDAVGAVRAAVEERLEVERGDGAVALHADAALHQDGVASAVAVEDLLARERDLDGAARASRKLGDYDLVVEGVTLSAEAAAVGRGDDAYVRGGHPQSLRERAVYVVRRLGRRPERELFVGVVVRDGRVLLHRQVRVALVEEYVFAHDIGLAEALVHVAELKVDVLVYVAAVAVVVYARLRDFDGLFDRSDGRERLVLDFDQVHRLESHVLIHRGDGRDGVAYEANLVQTERVLVLRDGEYAVRDGQVFACDTG